MLKWQDILERARPIVESYDTGVTLRQLFYRLVSIELLPNTVSAYKTLSSRTAEARRAGAFPDLIDRTRSIHRFRTFDSPIQARGWLSRIYRRDRTEGQALSLYLGVEKAGIIEQLQSWFGDLGLPIIALGGFSSQTFVDEVIADSEGQGRQAVLIYAGDFDPSGVDIQRDFCKRASKAFSDVRRIALSQEQIEQYHLPVLMGKEGDSRAAGFVRKYGELMQVELDALPPDELRRLYQAEINNFFDASAYQTCLDLEAKERALL